MSKKADDLVKSWNMPNRTEERIAVTSRLDFTTYAKLHALKVAFPKRSVNEIINDVLKTGLDEIIDSLGEPHGSSVEFIEEAGGNVEISENLSYRYHQAYRMIMDGGKSSDILKKIVEVDGEEK
jgi:hypothetical protein